MINCDKFNYHSLFLKEEITAIFCSMKALERHINGKNMKNIKRLIDLSFNEMNTYNANELKESIRKCEGRVFCGQTNSLAPGIISGTTNAEIIAALGTDMILMNAYNVNNDKYNKGMQGYNLKDIKNLTRNMLGVFLEAKSYCDDTSNPFGSPEFLKGRVSNEENINECLNQGVQFMIIGGNPGMQTKLDDTVEAVKNAKKIIENRCLIMAGKWEEGVDEKIFGDPNAEYDSKTYIKKLVDAGCDVVIFAAPGSRVAINVDCIRDLVTYTHSLGALAMCLLDSSVEGADTATIRQIALMMKQTGADIHTIGDAGYNGIAVPENICAMSLALRGRKITLKKMATRNRE